MKLRAFLLLIAASTLLGAAETVVVRKPAAATEYTVASRAHFGVWTDPKSWKLNLHPANRFTLEFRHSRQNIAGVLMAESAVVPFEGLAQRVLERGRPVFGKLNVVSRESRTVCGKEVLFLVTEGTANDAPYTIYGYYYSGPEGTVQSSVAFPTADLELSRGFALSFLNGLQIGSPGGAPATATTAVRAAANPVPAVSFSMPAIAGVAKVDIKALNASVPNRPSEATLAKLKAMFTGDPATVAKRFQPAADKKDPFAMYVLGQFYASGTGVPADPARAVDLMKQAVATGLPAAEICLGSWYVNGYQVSKDWNEAERLLRKPAEAGVADAEERLGEILLFSDPKAGIDFLQKAAGQGWALGEYRLGCCYASGTGVEKNAEEEVKWLQRASQHGNVEAMECLGVWYVRRNGAQDLVEAVKLFAEAAKAGLPEAQNNLGVSLRDGIGTPTDKSEAVKWFQKAAEQGSAVAQENLGYTYARGTGVPKDMKQALFWYEKAAKQGQAWAQYYLAVAYVEGNGVVKDVRVAMDWFRKAADQHAPFCYTPGCVFMGGEDVPQDKVEAVKWFRKGAEGGDAKCQEELAECYCKGLGVEKDLDEAQKWGSKAAESGVPSAQFNWGVMNMNGFGLLPQNVSVGVEWVRKAAEQGYGLAEYNLGIAYRDGTSVAMSPEEAAKWFRLAAIHGEPHGENAYGYVLAIGLGVKQDLVEAYKWYVLAMAQKEAESKARAEVNKKAIVPQMTSEQIQEGEKRAASFVPEKKIKDEFDR